MEVMRGRRLMTIFLAFVLSFSLCALLPFSVWIWILIGSVVLCAVGFLLARRIHGKNRFRTVHIVLLALAVAFGVFHAYRNPVGFPSGWNTETEYVFRGTVTGVEREMPYASSYHIKIENGNDSVLCLCETDHNAGFHEGDVVRIRGKATPAEETFDRSKGIRATIDFSEHTVVSYGEKGKGAFSRLNDFFSSLLLKRLGEETGSFASAVLLGNRNLVSPAIRINFRVIGFSHVLAVSGLHLSVLIGFLELFLRFLPIPRRIRRILLIPAVVCFALLTGASASVVRASIMFLFFAVSSLLWEDNDGLTSLFGALALILAFSPFSLFDIGLWLSFSATLGILLFSPALSPIHFSVRRDNHPILFKVLNKVLNTVISLILTAVVASFFTLPILYFFYGTVSIMTPAASLVLIPFITVLLPLYLLTLAIGFWPFAAGILSSVCGFLTNAMLGLSERFAEWDDALISLSYPFSRVFLIVLAVFLAFVLFTPWIKPKHAFLFILVFSLTYGGFVYRYEKTVFPVVQTELCNTKRNDAVLFRYHGKTVAVDVSGGSYAAMIPYSDAVYEDFHAGCIDVLVLTHCHTYHAGTLAKLGGKIKIKTVLYPEPQNDAEKGYVQKMLLLEEEYGIRFISYRQDASVSIDDLTLALPNPLRIGRSTHDVIAFSLDRGVEKLLCYAGSGLSELPAFWTEYADYPLWIYGSHGPLYKIIVEDAFPGLALGEAGEYISGTDVTVISDERVLLPSLRK